MKTREIILLSLGISSFFEYKHVSIDNNVNINKNCPLPLHKPELLPALRAAKPGCSQPGSRALFPQEALLSPFPTVHSPSPACPERSWHGRAQAGQLWAQHSPNTGAGRRSGCFAAVAQRDGKGPLPLVSLGWVSGWL